MLSIFGSKNIKELDQIIKSLEANMSNNYKDNAQANLTNLKSHFEQLKDKGKVTSKQNDYYNKLIMEYSKKMEGFTHKDQKPYWV